MEGMLGEMLEKEVGTGMGDEEIRNNLPAVTDLNELRNKLDEIINNAKDILGIMNTANDLFTNIIGDYGKTYPL